MKKLAKSDLPKISFILLSYNDAAGVASCLRTVVAQQYPRDKIEIIVVDDGSTDGTVQVGQTFGAKILINGTHDMYRSWAVGLHAITGDFTYLLEQDIELRDRTFLKKMIHPLLVDERLAGSFTRKYPRSDQSWTNQYIAHHPAQADPLYEFFSPRIESTISEQHPDYAVCDYSKKKIPPISRMLYRTRFLMQTPIWNDQRCFDFETLLAMISCGYSFYAYVPSAGIYHHHAKSLRQLLAKRVRNLNAHYVKCDSPYKYTWFDTSSIFGLFKIAVWIVYANLFFPAVLRGVWRTLKHRDLVMMMEPIVTIATTDVILFSFLRSTENRSYLFKTIKKSIGHAFGKNSL